MPVFLRSCAEVAAIAAQEPFRRKAVEASKGKLQVMLLAKKPTAAARKKVLALATDEDLLAIEGRELYWLPSGGTLESDARPQGDREGPRQGHAADDGHDRADRRQALLARQSFVRYASA